MDPRALQSTPWLELICAGMPTCSIRFHPCAGQRLAIHQYHQWQSGTDMLAVRMQDHKKMAAGPPAFDLASVDLVSTDKPCFHIAQHLPAIKCSPVAS